MSTLFLYIVRALLDILNKWHLLPQKILVRMNDKIDSFMRALVEPFRKSTIASITRVDLIDMSMKSMFSKKARTLITISGMTLGIGLIVFLVSVGYGLEKLVISRIARLEETRQIDAIPAIASNVKIDDKTLATFKSIEGVKKVLPVIGVVGRVNYNSSKTDVALYGVLADYLVESATKPKFGRIFANQTNPKSDSKKVTKIEGSEAGEVAGVQTIAEHKIGEKLSNVLFRMTKDSIARVRTSPSISGDISGYTSTGDTSLEGMMVLGGYYPNATKSNSFTDTQSGDKLAVWIKAKYPLLPKISCDTVPDANNDSSKCIDGYLTNPQIDSRNKKIFAEGYISTLSVDIIKESPLDGELASDVLGISDENGLIASPESNMISSTNSILTNSELADLMPQSAKDKTKIVTISATNATHETVINKALAKVLGFASLEESIGKKLTLAFEVTGDLAGSDKKIVSSDMEYTIVGATEESNSPIIYVPISDIRLLGLKNYSQVKIVTNSQEVLPKAREKIESLGYKTSSVVDTISQIEQLFSSVRTILGMLGVVALSVAALGMFNTLTVSLLERTHEIGMMKAIGMKSTEVKDLFLTESMIMGFSGGIGGLLIGFLGGKLVSLILTSFSLFKGEGVLDVTYIPQSFTIMIIGLSLFVGIATGLYPAWRATKISALDALRYE